MGGEGSIFSMIITSRNNRKLLRKKSIFAKSEGRFDDPDKATFGPLHQEIEIKHLSPEELKIYHDRTIKANRKTFLIRLSVTIVVLTIFTFLAIAFGKEIEKNIAHKKQVELQQRITAFNNFMMRGDRSMKNQNWPDAIHSYKSARNIFPDNKTTYFKILAAYSASCRNTGYYCKAGKEYAEELALKFPNDQTIQDYLDEFNMKYSKPD